MSPTTLETRKNIIRSFWNYVNRVKGTEISDKFFDDVIYRGISSGGNLIKKLQQNNSLRIWKIEYYERK